MKEITEDEFWETYKPQLNSNYLDPNDCVWNGCMYETFGREHEDVLEMVKTQPNRVWTLLEGDETETIVSGYHYVNRLGYFITEIPALEDIDVKLDME